MTRLLMEVRSGNARLIVPDAVLAQVWRSGEGRQARIATLVGLRPDQCRKVPPDTDAAKLIGSRVGMCGHGDIVDVHVPLAAEQYGTAVVTPDRQDITAVSRDLFDRIVDI